VLVVQLVAAIADMTRKLSRAAVFVGLVRLEEERYEPRPFRDALVRIEDHAVHGMYSILCRLHVIHQLASSVNETIGDSGVGLSASVDTALASVQLIEMSRPTHRHLRTFSIITDLAQLLQHLTVALDYYVAL